MRRLIHQVVVLSSFGLLYFLVSGLFSAHP